MKYVQIGILVALVVVAGLLYKVYKQQSVSPKVEAPVAAAPAPVTPAQGTPEQAAAPAATQQAGATPPAAAPAREQPAKKPSPSPAWRKAKPAARVAEPAAEVAQAPPSPTPAAPVPQPAAPSPAPQPPVPETPPPSPQPAPPPAAVALTPPSGTVTAPREPHKVTVPAGTLLTVRLSESLSSEKNQAGDSFTASLDQPLVVDGFVIAERGSRLEGRILEAEQAGRVRGVASLAIHLVRLHTSDGQDVRLQTEKFVKQGPTSTGEDVKKVGAGAAIGAAIGAIAGGGKGAAIGAGVGGAAGTGTVMATRGKAAVLPSETRISFRLQEAVTLTERVK